MLILVQFQMVNNQKARFFPATIIVYFYLNILKDSIFNFKRKIHTNTQRIKVSYHHIKVSSYIQGTILIIIVVIFIFLIYLLLSSSSLSSMTM